LIGQVPDISNNKEIAISDDLKVSSEILRQLPEQLIA
jgi:hypothetical protein